MLKTAQFRIAHALAATHVLVGLAGCSGSTDNVSPAQGEVVSPGGEVPALPGPGAPPGALPSGTPVVPGPTPVAQTPGSPAPVASVPAPAGSAPTGPVGGQAPPSQCTDAPKVSFGALRRVTRVEYDNLVRDLLGEERNVAQAFGQDGLLGGFSVNSDSPVSELQIEQYMEVSESVAAAAVDDLDALLGCNPEQLGEAECARDFIEGLALRAYRRPPTATEVETLMGVYETGAATNFQRGIRVALQAMLQSPHFLYHVEFGADAPAAEVVALDPYEQAARLSFFLWQSAPDSELFEAAAAGTINTVDGLRAQAQRMLADPKARRTLRTFHSQWLGLGELEEKFDLELADSMREATLQAIDEIVWDGSGSLDDYFSTNVGFLDGKMREIYGIEDGNAAPDEFRRYELDAVERGGLLTRAAFLGANSPPSGRGQFIREELLCGIIPPPPPGVTTELPESEPGEHPRMRWERHVSDPSCAGCHLLMDQLGFGFENYDTEGRYRTMDGDFVVDASGEVLATTDIDGPFVGAQELQQKLAQSQDVHECVSQQWLRFALGREPRTSTDACTISKVTEAFESGSHNVQQLLMTVIETDAFRFRRTQKEEN